MRGPGACPRPGERIQRVSRTSLPDTFLEERKTDRGSSQYGGEERKKPHEIVRSSRTNKPMLGGRSQWMHRLYYGNSGTSKSRIFLARCTDIKRKHWPFL